MVSSLTRISYCGFLSQSQHSANTATFANTTCPHATEEYQEEASRQLFALFRFTFLVTGHGPDIALSCEVWCEYRISQDLLGLRTSDLDQRRSFVIGGLQRRKLLPILVCLQRLLIVLKLVNNRLRDWSANPPSLLWGIH